MPNKIQNGAAFGSPAAGPKPDKISEAEKKENGPAANEQKPETPERKTKKSTGDQRNPKEPPRSSKPNFEVKPIPSMITKETLTKEKDQPQKETEWLESEGQLAVDVFQTEDNLVIQAPIAGMKVEDLDVIIEEEVVTVKGTRKNPFTGKPTGAFIEECYWGPFSRKIILPLDTDGSRADASMKRRNSDHCHPQDPARKKAQSLDQGIDQTKNKTPPT